VVLYDTVHLAAEAVRPVVCPLVSKQLSSTRQDDRAAHQPPRREITQQVMRRCASLVLPRGPSTWLRHPVQRPGYASPA
jgi:hypothetical protein